MKECCTYVALDKTIIVWTLVREDTNYGIAKRALRGHNHFVSDVVVSSDGQFALSGSWDGTLRLWDLQTGMMTVRDAVANILVKLELKGSEPT